MKHAFSVTLLQKRQLSYYIRKWIELTSAAVTDKTQQSSQSPHVYIINPQNSPTRWVIVLCVSVHRVPKCPCGAGPLGRAVDPGKPLLFINGPETTRRERRHIESPVHTVRTFSEDNGLPCGIDKCAITSCRRAADVRQTYVRQYHRLMPPALPIRGGA